MIRIFLFLLIVQMLTPAAAKPGFVNLATTARIKASSEPKNQRLMAGVVADGRVAPALFTTSNSTLLRGSAKSWEVRRKNGRKRSEDSIEIEILGVDQSTNPGTE